MYSWSHENPDINVICTDNNYVTYSKVYQTEKYNINLKLWDKLDINKPIKLKKKTLSHF